ncbi:MAG: hypothetical protein HYZ31_10815 [Gammaproteobacteria bacterium]|nr:hypothetical protein [Gammaproteobacteria bacterium]
MTTMNRALILLTGMLFAAGCSPDLPGGDQSSSFPGELTSSEFNVLNNEQKYQVANKLLGTIFRGVPVDDFYDISAGVGDLRLKSGNDFLATTRSTLSSVLTQEQRNYYDMVITDRDSMAADSLFSISFSDSDGPWPKHLPLARMYAYPLSKDVFDNWIAYVLANTILFSPAEEIDSATIRDVQKVIDKLREDLRQNKSVRQIISRHQRTQENWRRFRSPEDNTREMIEIYLGLFDRDADVPRAARACQNLYLTGEADDYELISSGFTNTEPQYVLDTYIVSCDDFYDLIANHPLVMQRVTTVLVEYFFFTKSGVERAQIVNQIVSSNPQTFQDIFTRILFSKAYLLDNERPKSPEETFFSLAHQMDWKPYRLVLNEMAKVEGVTDTEVLSLKQMGWHVMSLKLGRFTGVPLDTLSFANYHRGIREKLLLGANGSGDCGDETGTGNSRCRWANGMGMKLRTVPTVLADTATAQARVKYEYEINRLNKLTARNTRVLALAVDDYIDYVFLTGLQRKANDTEKSDLKTYFTTRGYLATSAGISTITSGRHDEMAQVMFDYMSRLPEFYYFLRVN